MVNIANIFRLPIDLPDTELFESLLTTQTLRIERIISTGQTTPVDTWYDQEQDEWVILLQGTATIAYEGGSRCNLAAGDYLFIPAHQRHRVEYTSCDPACVWLAIHFRSYMGSA